MSAPNKSEAERAAVPQSVTIKLDRSNTQKSPHFIEVYANDTYVQVTPWDLRMMFSVVTDLGTDQNQLSVLRVADVRMSLHHAKRVAALLTRQIEQYEKENGPLKVSD
jgi:hypothetical protein